MINWTIKWTNLKDSFWKHWNAFLAWISEHNKYMGEGMRRVCAHSIYIVLTFYSLKTSTMGVNHTGVNRNVYIITMSKNRNCLTVRTNILLFSGMFSVLAFDFYKRWHLFNVEIDNHKPTLNRRSTESGYFKRKGLYFLFSRPDISASREKQAFSWQQLA